MRTRISPRQTALSSASAEPVSQHQQGSSQQPASLTPKSAISPPPFVLNAAPVQGKWQPRPESTVQREPAAPEPAAPEPAGSTVPAYVPSASLSEALDKLSAIREEPSKAVQDEWLPKIQAELAQFANAIFSGFPVTSLDEFGMPTDGLQRAKFLDYTSMYLGGIEQARAHFSSIRKAAVPGEVYLHESAAAQLEKVNKLVPKMPSTTVAFAIRGRYDPADIKGRGMMAHAMGYAVDYFATTNVHLNDKHMNALVNLYASKDSGGPAYLNMGGYGEHRSMIKKIEAGTADPDEKQRFMTRFEQEYHRVAKASESFGESLGADGATQLKAIQQQYFELQYQKSKEKDPEKKAELEAQANALMPKVQTLIKPWHDSIQAHMGTLKARLAGKEVEKQAAVAEKIAALDQLAKEIEQTGQQIAAAEAEIQALKGKITALKAQKSKTPEDRSELKRLQAEKAAKTASKSQLQTDARTLGKRKKTAAGAVTKVEGGFSGDMDKLQREIDAYESLQTELATDLGHLLGTYTVKKAPKPKRGETQPPPTLKMKQEVGKEPLSFAQVLDQGYFTPNDKGFDLDFMKGMIENGFAMGAFWGETDAMHLELTRGVDSINVPDENQKTAIQIRWLGKKAKKSRKK
ncbi:MAG: hypothetical protein NW241_02830 [Bacteroidia bacterium]|nr:hypothetical protein [Bacteroidia bacterium]